MQLATEVNVPQYGQLDNGARFIRCDTDQDPFETFVRIIVKDVGAKPKLLVSCYGGAEYFTMTDDLEREFINGIGQVAATKDVWILTTGLNSGVSGLIAQGVHRNTLLNKNTWKPIVIGMSHWGTISEFTRDVLKQQASENRSTTLQNTVASLNEYDTKTLDKYHTHFLLLDDGRLNHYLNDDPRSKFVKTTCDQTQCHAVTIIVEGGLNTLEVIQHDLDAQRSVVIVHGSGRLASVLGSLLEKAGNTATITDDEVEQQLNLCPALCQGTSSNQASSNNFIDEEKMCVSCALYFIVEVLYKNAGEGPIVACSYPRTLAELDETYYKLIGPGLDGIDDHSNEEVGYRHRWMQFHGSPAVMVSYHFLLYICLLIAMFNFSINDVQAKNKYFWHYQRYQLTREYFEKPMFIYPPISLIIYVWLLIRLIIVRRTHFRVFKRLATPTWDTKWTDFENAATHKYARDLVEEKYRLHSKSNTTS
ncbi:unnamed protein product [Rotaria sordida]|uniref:TRPM SLOG domain-containing protein n=1 Tax=Rotaria sordida TaxID=392033 RepID=A0A815GKP1_9BILA|nr:unnamed protein product [Rotaria sordida]